jgi:hypothetical protein
MSVAVRIIRAAMPGSLAQPGRPELILRKFRQRTVLAATIDLVSCNRSGAGCGATLPVAVERCLFWPCVKCRAAQHSAGGADGFSPVFSLTTRDERCQPFARIAARVFFDIGPEHLKILRVPQPAPDGVHGCNASRLIGQNKLELVAMNRDRLSKLMQFVRGHL